MKFRKSIISVFCSLLVCGAGVVTSQAHPDVDEKRAEILKMRDDTLKELFKLEPELKDRVEDAVGYAVFSNVGVNLLIASVAGGKGVVVEQGYFGDKETYMKMGSAGLGLGLGAKDFRAVFIFTSKQVLKDFIDKGWEFSGQADATAKSDEKGGDVSAAGTLFSGMEVYQLTKNGLAIQATVQGTKYWKDKELN